MAYNEKLPKLWLSTTNLDTIDHAGECQCDGACPEIFNFDTESISSLREGISIGDVRDIALSDDIYLDEIKNHTVVLSATGANIVLLDTLARDLISYLSHTTVTVQELRQVVPWPPEVFERVVGLLLSEGIFVSPQVNLPSLPQTGSTTLTAWLHLANGCNLSCHYCYLAFNGKHMEKETAQRAIDAIFRSAVSQNYSRVKIKYAGGEPTLNFKTLMIAQNHAEMLSRKTNIALDTVMLTNGVRLETGQIAKLLSHNIRVMVSLDGKDEFHNLQRPFAGSQTKKSSRAVIQTVERLMMQGISPHISITITNKNIVGLSDLVNYLLDYDLRFSLNFYREPNNLPSYGEMSFSTKEIVSGLRTVFQVIEERLPSYSLLGNLSDRADLRSPHTHTCGVGENYMVINYDGTVAKCQMDIDIPVTTIDVDNPLNFVRSDTKGIKNLSADEKELKDCVWRYRCTGGCSRLAFQHTGRYDAKPPICEVYESILPDIVRLEALRLMQYQKPWDFGLH